jgi:hypothetical protein
MSKDTSVRSGLIAFTQRDSISILFWILKLSPFFLQCNLIIFCVSHAPVSSHMFSQTLFILVLVLWNILRLERGKSQYSRMNTRFTGINSSVLCYLDKRHLTISSRFYGSTEICWNYIVDFDPINFGQIRTLKSYQMCHITYQWERPCKFFTNTP